MPYLEVQSAGGKLAYRERLVVELLSDEHYTRQLLERLRWVVQDALASERFEQRRALVMAAFTSLRRPSSA